MSKFSQSEGNDKPKEGRQHKKHRNVKGYVFAGTLGLATVAGIITDRMTNRSGPKKLHPKESQVAVTLKQNEDIKALQNLLRQLIQDTTYMERVQIPGLITEERHPWEKLHSAATNVAIELERSKRVEPDSVDELSAQLESQISKLDDYEKKVDKDTDIGKEALGIYKRLRQNGPVIMRELSTMLKNQPEQVKEK